MSEQRKTIQFNPDLFKISEKGGKSQKKRFSSKKTPKIKIKSPDKLINTNTLKNRYLKHIREKQQKEYDKLFDETQKKYDSHQKTSKYIPLENEGTTTSLVISDIVSTPSSQSNNFTESVEYLQNISKQNEDKKTSHRSTISNRPITDNQFFNSIINTTTEPYPPIYKEEFDPNATLDGFPSNQNDMYQINPHTLPISNDNIVFLKPKPFPTCVPPPKYGCLKNGKLPTYRKFMNRTQNVYLPSQHYQPSQIVISTPSSVLTNNNNDSDLVPLTPFEKHLETKHKIVEKFGITPEGKIGNLNKSFNALKTAKRKKVIKRTHIIGRSNIYSKIGVLIKNRTIRNRITTQKQLLKQAKIDDIKLYLTKNGLIKTGTSAPDDVLRQMYESAVMIGGEVHNYNVENLLHNYLHP